MTFTDDDLKQLKAHLSLREKNTDDWACDECPHGKIRALLARLEAAEIVCAKAKELKFQWCESGEWEEIQEALQIWRKAAGK